MRSEGVPNIQTQFFSHSLVLVKNGKVFNERKVGRDDVKLSNSNVTRLVKVVCSEDSLEVGRHSIRTCMS